MRKEYLTWLTLNPNVKRNEQKLEQRFGHRSYKNPLHNRVKKQTSNYFYNFYGQLYSKQSCKHTRPVANYLY